MRFNELMTGARQDVVLKIYGEDLDKLSHYAELVGKQVSRVEGAEDLFVEKITGLPQIVIRYDREKVAYFGLNLEDINSVINSALAGKAAGVVFEGERRFDLTVRYAPDRRENIEDIRNIVLTTPAGQRVPLYQVAGIELEPGPAQIQRDDAKRRIIVGFNVRGRDVESIVHELRDRIAAEIKFEAGYFITYGGSFKNLEEARGRLLLAVPAALALIFIMLFFAFNSIKQSLLIYTAIPLSAIGGIISLWIRDMPFSISAGVGFIALFGVSVLNGIVLIAEFNKLKGSGIADTETRIKQGTKVRLRPVLMTALVASLGFLPMALSQGSGAEVQRPLATVVIGGLVSATFLTLVVLPCLYSLAEQVSNHKK
jgi:cobalt-zinc-cadmium resistance protein CzcA